MWLVNCSNYRLEFNDVDSPGCNPYWILSHTWGDDEVTFQDMQNLSLASSQTKGFQKIKAMCDLTSAGGLSHCWIDTCCIDKTSSAELSESINSMFYWYKQAERCVAYLEDLEPGRGEPAEAELAKCRWFTRGWTLQELIAPRDVQFYDSHWTLRGGKRELCHSLSGVTKIDGHVLWPRTQNIQGVLRTVSVAKKMSWAAGRRTTRIEDKAYCLLGIFDVNIPLLYGERGRAFTRLQHAIAQNSNDLSLFAWIADQEDDTYGDLTVTGDNYSGLLAKDPSQFGACLDIERIDDPVLPPPYWTITNAGIEMTTALAHTFGGAIITRRSDNTVDTKFSRRFAGDPTRVCLFLHCKSATRPGLKMDDWEFMALAVWLRKTRLGYVRVRPRELCAIRRGAMFFGDPEHIRISMSMTKQLYSAVIPGHHKIDDRDGSYRLRTSIRVIDEHGGTGIECAHHPAHLWDRGQLSFRGVDEVASNLTMGVIEITISSLPGKEPFSQTCWVFCGTVRKHNTASWMCPEPWIELVCEGPEGLASVLGSEPWGRSRLRNPFALFSLLGRLKARSFQPDPASLNTDCVVRCTPTLHIMLSASSFRDGDDGENAPKASEVTILVDRFDPTTQPTPMSARGRENLAAEQIM